MPCKSSFFGGTHRISPAWPCREGAKTISFPVVLPCLGHGRYSTNHADAVFFLSHDKEEGGPAVFVASLTSCFPDLSLVDALERMGDLQYSAVEISINERGSQITPSQVTADLEAAIVLCRDTHRLDLVAYDVIIDAEGEEYIKQFTACCRLAKATKVVTMTVESGMLGMPFNEEVSRLRRLVEIAAVEGVRIGIKSEMGRFSEDPNTVVTLCEHVKGLGLTLDPSHYIIGPHAGKNYDHILKYVHHVRLRDTSKDELQVRVGQGIVDYNKLLLQLGQLKYDRALCVDIAPTGDAENHNGEMRKLRLLLESLL